MTLSKSPSQLNADLETPERERVRDTAFVFVPVHSVNMRQEPVKVTLQTNRAFWKPWNGIKKMATKCEDYLVPVSTTSGLLLCLCACI